MVSIIFFLLGYNHPREKGLASFLQSFRQQLPSLCVGVAIDRIIVVKDAPSLNLRLCIQLYPLFIRLTQALRKRQQVQSELRPPFPLWQLCR